MRGGKKYLLKTKMPKIKKSKFEIPEVFFVDKREKDLNATKDSLKSNEEYIKSCKRSIIRYKIDIKKSEENIIKANETIKMIEANIKKNSIEKEKKKFLKDQTSLLQTLPIDRFYSFDFRPLGSGSKYKAIVFQTKKLITDKLDKEQLTELKASAKSSQNWDSWGSRSYVQYFEKPEKIGRFLVIILYQVNRSNMLIPFSGSCITIISLDNDSTNPLPCINWTVPCFGNIGGVVSGKYNKLDIAGLVQTITDYLTSSTFYHPYAGVDAWKIAFKNFATTPTAIGLYTKLRTSFCRDTTIPLIDNIVRLNEDIKKITIKEATRMLVDGEVKTLKGDWSEVIDMYHDTGSIRSDLIKNLFKGE